MTKNEQAADIVAMAIIQMIRKPSVSWDDAEKLANHVLAVLSDHDKFVVDLPEDGNWYQFRNPRGKK